MLTMCCPNLRTPDALNCNEKCGRAPRMAMKTAAPLLASNGSILTASRPFDSLFKVLFIFPSRYLFAIGLVPIFSFRWNLPPIFGCIPKQPDSSRTPRIGMPRHAQRGSHPLRHPVPRDLNVCFSRILESASLNYNSPKHHALEISNLSFSLFTRRY
jgi:hypothetical protein